jgi:hypothetical protein
MTGSRNGVGDAQNLSVNISIVNELMVAGVVNLRRAPV